MNDERKPTGSDDRHRDADPEVCKELAARISEYIDGELPLDLRLRVEEHLRGCANCRRFVESVRRTRELAHLLGPPEIPEKRLKEISRGIKNRLPE